MADAVSKHGMWSSRLLFVLAAVGSAVGLGNIWKFPYITGENGGGAFVLVYLACIAVIGVPVMMAEMLLGRAGRESPINTVRKLAAAAGAKAGWSVIGWMGVLAGFLILSFYAVVAGWVLHYIFLVGSGTFDGAGADFATRTFSAFASETWQEFFWYTAFMAATTCIVARGVSRGLEAAVRWLMPLLLALLLVLVVYAATVGEFAKAVRFLFAFDASKLTAKGVLEAMGHAFFTLSLGMGAIMAYGAYVPARVSVASTAITIAVLDTAVALAAGLAIFPVVFMAGLEAGAGPSLIFHSLAVAFGGAPLGAFIGALFFLLVAFAALTSAISLLEPAFAFLVERYDLKRRQVAIGVGATCWLLGLGSVWSDSFFGVMDDLTGKVMLPLGGLLVAIFAGCVVGKRVVAEQLGFSEGWKWTLWVAAIRVAAPLGVLAIFANIVLDHFDIAF